MYIVLLALGVIVTVAGGGMTLFGVANSGFEIGNIMISAGMTGLVGGLIVIALANLARELRATRQPDARKSSRPAAPAAAPGRGRPAAPRGRTRAQLRRRVAPGADQTGAGRGASGARARPRERSGRAAAAARAPGGQRPQVRRYRRDGLYPLQRWLDRGRSAPGDDAVPVDRRLAPPLGRPGVSANPR